MPDLNTENSVMEKLSNGTVLARFIGKKTYLKGLTVNTNNVYELDFMGIYGENKWYWIRISDPSTNRLYRAVLGKKYAECPYQSIDSLLDNWQLLE